MRATTYQEAGVDIAAADSFVQRIKPIIKKTDRPEVLSSIGHYAGLFALQGKFQAPVLVASTDGVGTKIKLALQMGRLEGLGQDLVAMSANDILCLGAEPLFFLDYFATGHLQVEQATQIIRGIASACETVRCSLLGGETAEMPSIYQQGDIDLAGFIVGVVEKKKIIDGAAIQEGDLIVGLASSGPHSNGFSLIRKVVEEQKLILTKKYPPLDRPLGEILLEPTRLYGPAILKILSETSIHGMAHITGGGFDNLPRILPDHGRAVIHKKSWPRPPLFDLIQQWGKIPESEMQRVFNLGIGMILVVDRVEENRILPQLAAQGETAWVIGSIEGRKKGELPLTVV